MIEVQDLTKYYDGFLALDSVSFKIEKGQVVGLLGLNGAGKTTCLRLLTGFLMPSDGACRINGIDVYNQPLDAKKAAGYLPETPPLYSELNIDNYLRFVGRMREVYGQELENELKRVEDITGITSVKKSLIRNLSLGYRKRVGIAQALMGSPDVLIFDEPVSGLDPRQIVEMRNLIRSLAGSHTILISSHILTEIEQTCDRVLVIHKGKLKGDIHSDQMKQMENIFMELTSDAD